LKPLLFLLFSWVAAFNVQAHGFEERYDLPVPLAYVIVGACAMVLLTFVVALVFVRRPASGAVPPGAPMPQTPPLLSSTPIPFGLSLSKPAALRPLAWLIKGASLLLFALTLISALWGTSDPLMNLAPTMVWIIAWIGLSFVVIALGNIWPVLDPWRSSFVLLDMAIKKIGIQRGLTLGWPWPPRLGLWPAAMLLLVWCALEVIYPLATSPFKLGWVLLGWTLINWAGMACFGREVWQAHADLFAVYFSRLARTFKPSPVTPEAAPTAGHIAVILAMLATVLFDGLHGGSAWLVFDGLLKTWVPQWLDINGYVAGTLGLLSVWLTFLLAYLLTCQISASTTSRAVTGQKIAHQMAPTLIPIAAAYLIAHNFSNLLIQGQTIIALLSDPLGRQWDVLGTAKFYPDISVVDAKLTWLVAVTAIVAGHVLSIWQAHRVALTWGLPTRRTALATLPLTALMMVYTAISLVVIAAPMVNDGP
jgi:hypothetical protein